MRFRRIGNSSPVSSSAVRLSAVWCLSRRWRRTSASKASLTMTASLSYGAASAEPHHDFVDRKRFGAGGPENRDQEDGGDPQDHPRQKELDTRGERIPERPARIRVDHHRGEEHAGQPAPRRGAAEDVVSAGNQKAQVTEPDVPRVRRGEEREERERKDLPAQPRPPQPDHRSERVERPAQVPGGRSPCRARPTPGNAAMARIGQNCRPESFATVKSVEHLVRDERSHRHLCPAPASQRGAGVAVPRSHGVEIARQQVPRQRLRGLVTRRAGSV